MKKIITLICAVCISIASIVNMDAKVSIVYAQGVSCPAGTRVGQVSGVSRCVPFVGYICPKGMVLGYVSQMFVCNPRVTVQFWKSGGIGTGGGGRGGGGGLTNGQIEALIREFTWATSTDGSLTFGIAKNGCTIKRGEKTCRLQIAWNGTLPGIQITADNVGFADTIFVPKITPGTSTISVGYQTVLRATQGSTQTASHIVRDVVRCAAGSIFGNGYVCVREDPP